MPGEVRHTITNASCVSRVSGLCPLEMGVLQVVKLEWCKSCSFWTKETPNKILFKYRPGENNLNNSSVEVFESVSFIAA